MSARAIDSIKGTLADRHGIPAESQILLPKRARNNASIARRGLQYTTSREKHLPLATQHDHKSRRAPYVMLIGLVLGLAVSLAHHFMDKSLDARVVADVEESTHLSQSWILSINTLLALIVKTSFAVAVGTAFVQCQWSNLHRNTFTIRELDSITSVLGDHSQLMKKNIWKRVPLLATMALGSWLLPLAVIYPPGALTIGTPAEQRSVHFRQVPQLTLRMNSIGWMSESESTLVYWNHPPSHGTDVFSAQSVVRRVMFAMASSGQMLSLTPKYANESYHLDFFAPNLNCTPAADEVVYNATLIWGWLSRPDLIPFTKFAAWAVPATAFFDPTLQNIAPVTQTIVDVMSNDASRIFFMSNGGVRTDLNQTPIIATPEGPLSLTRVNVTECKLYNASYSVDFEFKNSQQTTTALISNLNPVSFGGISDCNTSCQSYYDNATVAYFSMMQSFGLFLVGEAGDTVGTVTPNGSLVMSNIDLVGNIDLGNAENVSDSMSDLFQNFTLSLLTEPSLSNETWSSEIPVTVFSWPITYIYTPQNLLIAYGTAFIASLICCLVGMHAFMINDNNSYQNLLSTYLRVTNKAELRSLINDGDLGADPLPKSLEKTKLSIVGGPRPTVRMTGTEKFWWRRFGV